MGHTVAIKSFEGVEDALSLPIPQGCGQHRRQVYIKVREGYDFEEITGRIRKDPYFSHDETHFYTHDDIDSLIDVGHGVHMERKGVAGRTHNQKMEFIMSVTNPAATAQVLVSTARAATRQAPGAYCLLEIPIIDFLPGERESLIERLV
jgi:diaminopimelate dehydrogenase